MGISQEFLLVPHLRGGASTPPRVGDGGGEVPSRRPDFREFILLRGHRYLGIGLVG